MKLGFYYHIAVEFSPTRGIGMPAFLGKFLDSLAQAVEVLVLIAHTRTNTESSEYYLTASNVELIDLGNKGSAYDRFYFPHWYLKKAVSAFLSVDHLLIRAPSPLAAAFSRYVAPNKIVYLIVGSYKEGLRFLDLPWYKSWAVKILNYHMHARLAQATAGKRLLVNSLSLLNEYSVDCKRIAVVNTTTLTINDFFLRLDTCTNADIKLLFVGRIEFAKGLKECITVCHRLNSMGIPSSLDIIGWEEGKGKYTQYLRRYAEQLGVSQFVNFLGRKSAGAQLLAYYRTHDIYLLPTYHEGFPRTIWEAFASCIPVVTTTVGSIPDFINHKKEAILVPPGDVDELLNGVVSVIHDGKLRRRLISSAYERVKEVALEVQTRRIIEFIER